MSAMLEVIAITVLWIVLFGCILLIAVAISGSGGSGAHIHDLITIHKHEAPKPEPQQVIVREVVKEVHYIQAPAQPDAPRNEPAGEVVEGAYQIRRPDEIPQLDIGREKFIKRLAERSERR